MTTATVATTTMNQPNAGLEAKLSTGTGTGTGGEYNSDNLSLVSTSSSCSFSLVDGVIKPILDHLTLSHRLDLERKEKDRLEKDRQREERERERKWQQFKKDEAFVMDVMNRELEREQAILARKREKKDALARREAELKLQEKQRALQEQRKRKDQASKRMRKSSQRINQYLNSPKQSNKEGWVIEVGVDVDVDGNKSECDSTAEMEDSEWEGQPQKTIKWCLSVDDEQERRRIHRLTHPVKKGGIARRVRRNPDRYQKKTVEDIEQENAQQEQQKQQQQPLHIDLDVESVEDMVDEYRKACGLPTMEEGSLEDGEDEDEEELQVQVPTQESTEQPSVQDDDSSSSSEEESEEEEDQAAQRMAEA